MSALLPGLRPRPIAASLRAQRPIGKSLRGQSRAPNLSHNLKRGLSRNARLNRVTLRRKNTSLHRSGRKNRNTRRSRVSGYSAMRT